MTATLARLGFTIDAKAFAGAVTWAAKRVPARPTVPALGGILLEVVDGELTVSGTDQNASASATVGVDGFASSDGRALVSGRLLAALLGTFPDKPITAAVGDSSLTLAWSATGRVSLPLMDVDEYPSLPEMPPAIGQVDGAALAHTAKLVGSSCDVNGANSSIAMLTGLFLSFGAETLGMEASNRQRAAVADVPWTLLDAGRADATALPLGSYFLDAVGDLAGDGPVSIGVDGGLVSLSTAHRSVVMPQIADPWNPNFRKLFVMPEPSTARIEVADLKSLVDQIRLMADAKDFPHVRLDFGPAGLAVSGGEHGASTAETIECDYDGPKTTILLSVRHLTGVLSAAGATEIELLLTKPNRPVLFRPVGDSAYQQMLAPMSPDRIGKS